MSQLLLLSLFAFYQLCSRHYNPIHGDGDMKFSSWLYSNAGAYHTELTVDLDKKEAKVWLLDINFQNPQTVNSEVLIQFIVGKNLGDKKILCSTKNTVPQPYNSDTTQQPNNSNSKNSDTNASLKPIHVGLLPVLVKGILQTKFKKYWKGFGFFNSNGVKGMTAEYNWSLSKLYDSLAIQFGINQNVLANIVLKLISPMAEAL